jgi:hypothetical protein
VPEITINRHPCPEKYPDDFRLAFRGTVAAWFHTHRPEHGGGGSVELYLNPAELRTLIREARRELEQAGLPIEDSTQEAPSGGGTAVALASGEPVDDPRRCAAATTGGVAGEVGPAASVPPVLETTTTEKEIDHV